MDITTTNVQSALQDSGLGSFAAYAGTVKAAVDQHGLNADALLTLAAQNGQSVSRDSVDRFISAMERTLPVDEAAEPDAFARAADVIRGAARNAGIDPFEVENVLVDAGLIDPEPEDEDEDEPEDEDDVVRSVKRVLDEALAPLIAFARQNGYRG